jgi:hypothetical protein
MTRLSWLFGFAAITLVSAPLFTVTAAAAPDKSKASGGAETVKQDKYRPLDPNSKETGADVRLRDGRRQTIPNPGKPKTR